MIFIRLLLSDRIQQALSSTLYYYNTTASTQNENNAYRRKNCSWELSRNGLRRIFSTIVSYRINKNILVFFFLMFFDDHDYKTILYATRRPRTCILYRLFVYILLLFSSSYLKLRNQYNIYDILIFYSLPFIIKCTIILTKIIYLPNISDFIQVHKQGKGSSVQRPYMRKVSGFGMLTKYLIFWYAY